MQERFFNIIDVAARQADADFEWLPNGEHALVETTSLVDRQSKMT
jgi:hypothetical protein